jgi:MFS transporter, DHA1 family, multidrug resistance protein
MNSKKELKYLILIVVVFIAACIETDIYLPAFPDMMAWFGASEGEIQGLLTWNFIGICISGPLYGPLSDAFGRKKPLMIALGMFLAGSIITIFSQNFDQMLWGRILQGIGSGGCFTLGSAIIFDAFQKEKAIDALNKINMIIPLIMAAAPMLGGYLNLAFGFRSNFLAIGIFVLISFIICLFYFDETLPLEKRISFKPKAVLRDFKEALTNLAFWQLTMVICLLFAGYIAFLSGSSVLFVVEFGMSKSIFPLIQAAILGGWVAGSLALKRSIQKWGILKIKKFSLALCIVGGVILALTTLLTPRDGYFLTIGMVIYAFGANWIIGLYFPESMEILPHIKGIAASLITSARLLIAALVVGMTSALYNGTVYPLSIVFLATVVISVPTLILYERKRLVVSQT